MSFLISTPYLLVILKNLSKNSNNLSITLFLVSCLPLSLANIFIGGNNPDTPVPLVSILPCSNEFLINSYVLSKSCVSSNIDKELKHEFSLIKFDFVSKRIKHLFSNKLFEFHSFYDSIIQNIIKTYQKKHHHQILVL